MTYQKVQLIGNVGQTPEMRFTSDGTPVTTFSVATTEKISKQGPSGPRPCPQGWKESYNGKNWELTTWWKVTCWRGLAETVNQYVGKGQQVFVEGTVSGEAHDGNLNPRVWTGKDGVARASFELKADTVKFLGRSEGRSDAGESAPPEVEEEVLPF